jgi:hypothetical protein
MVSYITSNKCIVLIVTEMQAMFVNNSRKASRYKPDKKNLSYHMLYCTLMVYKMKSSAGVCQRFPV